MFQVDEAQPGYLIPILNGLEVHQADYHDLDALTLV